MELIMKRKQHTNKTSLCSGVKTTQRSKYIRNYGRSQEHKNTYSRYQTSTRLQTRRL